MVDEAAAARHDDARRALKKGPHVFNGVILPSFQVHTLETNGRFLRGARRICMVGRLAIIRYAPCFPARTQDATLDAAEKADVSKRQQFAFVLERTEESIFLGSQDNVFIVGRFLQRLGGLERALAYYSKAAAALGARFAIAHGISICHASLGRVPRARRAFGRDLGVGEP